MKVKKSSIVACLITLSFAFVFATGCVNVNNEYSSVNGTFQLVGNDEDALFSSIIINNGAWSASAGDKVIGGNFSISSGRLVFYKNDETSSDVPYMYALKQSYDWLRFYPVSDERITYDFTRDGSSPSTESKDVSNLSFTLSASGDYYSVSSADGSFGEVVIPSEYDGKPVKEISKLAFYRCLNIVRVVFPDSIEKVCDEAFRGCESLYSVYAGEGLSLVSEKAFYGCVSLRYFFANSLKTISNQAFFGTDMSGFTAPKTLEYIGDEAFAYTNIVSVNIHSSVSFVGVCAFAHCSNIESIYVDEANQKYSSYDKNCIVEKEQGLLIAGCSNTDLPMDGKVKIIGEGAMCDIDNIISIIFPVEITEIRRGAFENCKSIESIYYLGTSPLEWIAIKKTSNNVKFFNANVYIYSENEPVLNEKKTGYASIDGYNCTFWRYVGGKPVIWRFTEEHPPESNN